MAGEVGGPFPRSDGYSEADTERFFTERHRSARDDFARDRARVVHSAALRRLAAKTQVLSPANPTDFARNRLTHSLEVAQVGRELASQLQLNPDIVDAACLSHDLGHPPFGHNGERALNDWAQDIGGFEGNAQSLRILTRLEPKATDAQGRSVGLNLTRASLDATCKYPWGIGDDPAGSSKFGVYPDDAEVFAWMREGAPRDRRCVEAEVMDLSDDIAYSVHDFEDAVTNGYLNPRRLVDPAQHDELFRGIQSWVGNNFLREDLESALERLTEIPHWLREFSGTRRDFAQLKNLTSDLIGRFARAATAATQAAYPGPVLTRYGARVVVPEEVQVEIALLKGIIGAVVVSVEGRRELYREQRLVLTRLADALWAEGPRMLEPAFQLDFAEATDSALQRRVIVDQVASLTDQAALSWHARLVGEVDRAAVGVGSPRSPFVAGGHPVER